jgi:hypothetical protein
MLHQGFIAICFTTMAPKDRDIRNAVGWIAVPEPQLGFAPCMIYGQEYVPNARAIQPAKTYPKVYYAPPMSIGKAIIG